MGMKIKYSLTFSPDFQEWPRRTFNKGVEKANAAIGKMIFQQWIPKHFDTQGARDYGYKKRDEKYNRAKRRRTGRALPLVGPGNRRKKTKGGELRRQVLRAGLVRATPKRMTLKMGAPSHVKFRGTDGTGPDMVKELTTISKREEKIMFKLYRDTIAEFLENEPKKKRTRTR
jgi:hypothetical protein